MKNVITAVIFDCGEVLVNGYYGIERRLSHELERPVGNAELQTEELRQLFLGEISEEEFWETMVARFKWSISVARLKALIRENFTEVPGTLGIVKRLRAKGYSLGILSVHASEWVDCIHERFAFHGHFHHLSYSCYDKVRKPDAQAFELIAKRLEKEPAECLFIDDHIVNIEAAQKLGFHAHRFRSAEALHGYLLGRAIPY